MTDGREHTIKPEEGSSIAYGLIGRFKHTLSKAKPPSTPIRICPTCGHPLERDVGDHVTPNYGDLYIPTEGYDVIVYSNGNLKLIKINKEVI